MGIDPAPPLRSDSTPTTAIVIFTVLGIGLLALGAFALVGYWWVESRETDSVTPPMETVAARDYHGDEVAMNVPADDPLARLSSAFRPRLKAALEIQDVDARNDAVRMLATEVATEDFDALAALNEIVDPNDRDAAAYEVARKFGEAGRSEQALSVIETIDDPKLRDDAFRGVATGEWPAQTGDAITDEAVETIEAVDATEVVEEAEEIVEVKE